MPDYSDDSSKPGIGATWPQDAIAASYGRLEPLITPDQLRERYFFGQDLVSSRPNRVTGQYDVMSNAQLETLIEGAVSRIEAYLDIDIFPVQRDEKHPFDRVAYEHYGYFQLQHQPITSIEKLGVTPASGPDIYRVPLDWLDTGYLNQGQIFIVPLVTGTVTPGISSLSTAGSFFLTIASSSWWSPAFWVFRYTSGFKDGILPRFLNELIGTEAAIDVLSALAATNAFQSSQSLGIDALSQSTSGPGPQVYAERIKDLEQKKALLMKRCKSTFGRKIFADTI